MSSFDVQAVIDDSVAFYASIDRSIFGNFVTKNINELVYLDMQRAVTDGFPPLVSKAVEQEAFAALRKWRDQNDALYTVQYDHLVAEYLYWRGLKGSINLAIHSIKNFYGLLQLIAANPEHLDFFEAGIFDVAEIERFKSSGIDPELASRMVA